MRKKIEGRVSTISTPEGHHERRQAAGDGRLRRGRMFAGDDNRNHRPLCIFSSIEGWDDRPTWQDDQPTEKE